MKRYDVMITETSQKKVTVMAESLAHAEEKVEAEWNEGKHILTADDFAGARFDVAGRTRTRDMER